MIVCAPWRSHGPSPPPFMMPVSRVFAESSFFSINHLELHLPSTSRALSVSQVMSPRVTAETPKDKESTRSRFSPSLVSLSFFFSSADPSLTSLSLKHAAIAMSEDKYVGKTMAFKLLRSRADSNYNMWKGYVSICLHAAKAWSIVSREEKEPVKPGEDVDPDSSVFRHYERTATNFIKCSAEAEAILMNSCSEEHREK
jgi:hypothetical protein